MQGPIEILARAPLPTVFGDFTCVAFRHVESSESVHIGLVHGEPSTASAPPVRVHSECFTGEVLGSTKCDCRQQLEVSLEYIAERECGVLVYLRQEGRGIGLVNKLLAYSLQESEGLDTVDTNRSLGLPDDARGYEAAALFLLAQGIRRIELLTNNPAKIEGLKEHGVEIVRRTPVLVASTEAAKGYLATKIARMGHIVDALTSSSDGEDAACSGEPRLDEEATEGQDAPSSPGESAA